MFQEAGGNGVRTNSRKSHQLEHMVTISLWRLSEITSKDLISFFGGTLRSIGVFSEKKKLHKKEHLWLVSCTNFISRQVKLSLQEKLKAAVLGRGGKMKICPYSPRPSPQPVGKERDWSWPALSQFPAALTGLWSASFPQTGRICWLCCCNSRYIAKGCCAVQSFALLPTSAMLLPSFGLHPAWHLPASPVPRAGHGVLQHKHADRNDSIAFPTYDLYNSA